MIALPSRSAPGSPSTSPFVVAAIDGRVDSLEDAVEPPSGFKALRMTAPSSTGGTPTHLNYETEEFDYADEYNPATGMFTVKAAGVYAIQCASHVTAPGRSSR